MKTTRILFITTILAAGALVISAADIRTYTRSIEPVWDEAVKATRDADLVLTDSNRSEHWFQMESPPKTLKRTVHFEVTLTQTGDQTMVTVREDGDEPSSRSVKLIAKYLNALDDRMN